MSTPIKSTPKRGSGKRPKKRRFTGNMYTRMQSPESGSLPGCSAFSRKRKIQEDAPEFPCTNNFDGYRIIDKCVVFQAFQDNLTCKICGGSVEIHETLQYGLCSKFSIDCETCGEINSFRSSKMLGNMSNAPEVNRRAIYAFRCLGLGHSALKKFCGVMDLPPPTNQISADIILRGIRQATSKVAKESMENAAKEEIRMTGCSDICVSGDGTWKTRGHTSRIGVCSVIGAETGKVLDFEAMSTYCKGCEVWKGDKVGTVYDKWKENHEKVCLKNHSGSAGQMEVAGMVNIFSRSLEQYNARYVSYIGDGDTKTFSTLVKTAPYGDGVSINKVECVGHIQKRLGTRLRNVKSGLRGKKLCDEKGISGKGRLTDSRIDQLAVYYGNAIRANCSDLTEMRKAVWAVFYHTRSSDEEPTHTFCPKGEKSWCSYNRALATGNIDTFRHKNSVPAAVMDAVKHVFKDLSSPVLLKRCLGGKTQNANESFNSVVWRYCPKTSGCGRRIVDIAVHEAIITFNEGNVGRLNVMKALELQVGKYCVQAAVSADRMRLNTAERRSSSRSLGARRAKRRKRKEECERLAEKEGVTYAPGKF